MRPMAETFFLGRTPDGREPQKAGWVPQLPTYFFSSGSILAFVPQLGDEKKKRDKGGEDPVVASQSTTCDRSSKWRRREKGCNE